MEFHREFKTAIGRIGIIYRQRSGRTKVTRIVLPNENMTKLIRRFYPAARAGTCTPVAQLQKKIEAYLSGRKVSLPLDLIDWNRVSEFQKRVLLLEYAIPRGTVSTYGRLAKKLGRPRTARAVGTALARNPFPLVIPCHRAVRSDGSLGGYRGGVRLKKHLLKMEGVRFDRAGKVEKRQIGPPVI